MHTIGTILLWVAAVTFLGGAIVALFALTEYTEKQFDDQDDKGRD